MTATIEQIEKLRANWTALAARLGIAGSEAASIFADLAARHCEPHRHYHDLQHVAEVLDRVADLAPEARDIDAVLLAAWFHDAVYDPTAKDNEERSALLLRQAFAGSVGAAGRIDRSAGMILATAHAGIGSADDDTAILLDADLAILGAAQDRYRRYADDIRREYEWVEEAAYRAGRARVLEAFLGRERIYLTGRMFAEREAMARLNTRNELGRLRAGGA